MGGDDARGRRDAPCEDAAGCSEHRRVDGVLHKLSAVLVVMQCALGFGIDAACTQQQQSNADTRSTRNCKIDATRTRATRFAMRVAFIAAYILASSGYHSAASFLDLY